jgi:hypothetical protein
MARNVNSDSFYITCTSNKCREFYPENKTSSFKTRLKDPINLNNADQKWEVGVSSFTYSQAINNFGQCVLMELYIYDGNRIHTIPIEDAHVANASEMVNVIQSSIEKYADSFKDVRVTHEDFVRWMKTNAKRKFGEDHPERLDHSSKKKKRSIAITMAEDIEEIDRVLGLSAEDFEAELPVKISSLITQCVRKVIMICASLKALKENNPGYKSMTLYHAYFSVYLQKAIEKFWKQMRETIPSRMHEGLGSLKFETFFKYLESKNPTLFAVFVEMSAYEQLLFDMLSAHETGRDAVFSEISRGVQNMKEIVKGSVYDWVSLDSTKSAGASLYSDILEEVEEIMWDLENGDYVLRGKMDLFMEAAGDESNLKRIDDIFHNLNKWQTFVAEYILEHFNAPRGTGFLQFYFDYILLHHYLEQYSICILTRIRRTFPQILEMRSTENVALDTDGQEHDAVYELVNNEIKKKMVEFLEIFKATEKESRGGFLRNENLIGYLSTAWWMDENVEKELNLITRWLNKKVDTPPAAEPLPAHLVVPNLAPQQQGPALHSVSILHVDSGSAVLEAVNESDEGGTSSEEEEDIISNRWNETEMYIKPRFYGLSLPFDSMPAGATKQKGGSALYSRLISVKVVQENKIEFGFSEIGFDIAMTPSLMKAVGLGKRAEYYSLKALNMRIILRQCLKFDGDPEKIESFHNAVYQKCMEEGTDKYFRRENDRDRASHYAQAGIVKGDFLKHLYKKLSDENLDINEFITKMLLPKNEYMSFAQNFAKRKHIPLLDAVVYRLVRELPFIHLVSGDGVNFNPTDMIFIYTNIITPEDVDNSRLRVLEIMSLRVKGDNKIDQIEFSNTHYKRLDIDVVSEIEFLIATSLGTPVPFQYGPATIQLHFRRRR